MTTPVIILIVSVFLILDGFIVCFAVPRLIRSVWEPLERDFPPVEPAPDAVRRGFQSFSISLINLGWSLHVAVDDDHLHLYPAWIPRLWGMTPISVPWDRVQLRGRFIGGKMRARINKTDLIGPKWCLSLAER